MNTNYQIIKLSNGEDIICNIKEQSGSELSLEVVAPLKMDVMSRMTKKGEENVCYFYRLVDGRPRRGC